MSDPPRWKMTVRRARPEDHIWPLRWYIEVYDAHLNHYHNYRRGGKLRTDYAAFTERGAYRWVKRYIRKIEKSEASERKDFIL